MAVQLFKNCFPSHWKRCKTKLWHLYEEYTWVEVTKGPISLNWNKFFYLHHITFPMVKGKKENRTQYRVHCITRLKQPVLYLYLCDINVNAAAMWKAILRDFLPVKSTQYNHSFQYIVPFRKLFFYYSAQNHFCTE